MRDATRLDVYYNDSKALFIIPLYQRKYAWQKKHCQRLFEDLKIVHEKNLYSHFFGSIVSVKASETQNDLLIIDGQQRITTISILILAAINAVHNGDMVCDNDEFLNDVRKKYLYAPYRKGDRKIKLVPIEDDRRAYDALFTNDEDNFVSPSESGVTSNYLFFYDLIKSASSITFEDLIEAIERLIVIDICLDSKDNPQLIFESLNSCGKDLEEADKVRNYLLMSLTKEEQEEYYHTYWSKIEKYTDGEPTMFIRDYLTINTNITSSLDDLYFDFKKYDSDHQQSRKDLLADMLKYAKYYKMAAKGCTGNPEIDKKFKQLASIGSNVCMPFYLAFWNYADENQISEDIRYEVLDVVEAYWARRIICSYPANALLKIFASLHSDVLRIIKAHVKRGVELTVSYAELLKYILLKKQGTGFFPTDNLVKEEFPHRQVYKIPGDYKNFLFERMENLNSKEYDDAIIKKMKEGKITIEHIMPQHMSAQWKADLGENAMEINERYLHTFANLTLSGYNLDYSNRPYNEKYNGYILKRTNKDTKQTSEIQVFGFKDSAFKLSNYLKNHETFGEKELIERGQILLENFLKLWPMITTQYVPLEKEIELVTLDDDDVELTGRKILGFRYNGTRHDVDSWKEMLLGVCKILYNEKTSDMIYLSTKEEYLHSKQKTYNTKVADKCFVWTANDTKSKRNTLLYIFGELGIAPSELELELKPITETTLYDDLED